MTTPTSLADGNRLQRAYFRWAQPRYAAMPPDLRVQAEVIDRFLYTRRGLGFWLGLAGAVTGSSVGLWRAGMPVLLALTLSLLLWAALPFGVLVAWLQPQRFTDAALRRRLPWILVMVVVGALAGFMVGDLLRRGEFDLESMLARLRQSAQVLAPAALAVAIGLVVALWGVAQVRRQILEQELLRMRLEQERDAAARQAAEAQLKLLQGQIQPHFIFNTLAAAQHWVEAGDTRAPALLRALSGFLRGSTELLMRDSTLLADELPLVRHYLAIMQARLGDRLRATIDVDDALALRSLPPGLLLTMVENAVEHGVGPSLGGATVRVEGRVTADGWTLVVRDDGVGLGTDAIEGVGLRNTRERLRHAFGPRARFEVRPHPDGGTEARIEVQEEKA